MPKKLKIPGVEEWRGYKSDLDVRHLHSIFFGKDIDDVQEYFGGVQSIARMDELLFAPRPVFRYYVHAYARFLESDDAAEDSDSASAFLSLLEARKKRDRGSVEEVLDSLKEILAFVSHRQDHFDADVNIYGDFRARVASILDDTTQ